MAKTLVTTCPACGKVTQLFDLRRTPSEDIGNAIKRAATDGLGLEWVDTGCECPAAADSGSDDAASGAAPPYRFNLMQLMLVVTVVAVVLAVFRHPISLLFDEVVLKWAAVPWSLYGWFFFGTEIINPKKLGKNPMGIIVFLANVIVAVLLPMVVLGIAGNVVKQLWIVAGNRGQKPEKNPTGVKSD